MTYEDFQYPTSFPTAFVEQSAMTQNLLDAEPRSTNTQTSQPIYLDKVSKSVVQLVNGLDASFDYEVQATYDADSDTFDNAVTLSSASVASGAVDYYIVDDPWDYVRVAITPSSTPTSGSVIGKAHTD